jgi:hypothetical protein
MYHQVSRRIIYNGYYNNYNTRHSSIRSLSVSTKYDLQEVLNGLPFSLGLTGMEPDSFTHPGPQTSGISLYRFCCENTSKQEARYMTDEKLCEEKHKRVDERLDTHEKRLNNHSEEIDRLSMSDARNTNELTNLCKQIGDLVTTLRWLIGLLVTTLGGFFVYVIQMKLF